MKRNFYILFLLPFVLIINGICAQDDDYLFDHYSNKEGLTQATINCIIQDMDGYIWFGTQAGINKFNGYSFENIQYKTTGERSLSNNWVICMDEDDEGNIWVGTRNGLNKVSKDRKTITKYMHNPSDPESLNDKGVYGVHVDKDGVVWVKTFTALNKLDPKTNKFTRFEQKIDLFNAGKDRDRHFPIYEDQEGYLWIGSSEGLHRFHKGFQDFTLRLKHDPDNPNTISDDNITALIRDKQGYYWIGTANGLNKYDLKTGEVIRYMHNPDDVFSISDNDIFEIVEDYLGNIWVATGSGLNKLEKATERFISFQHSKSAPDGISNNMIRTLLQDNTYNLWIGTDAKGVDKIDLKRKNFYTIKPRDGKRPIDLSFEIIASIYKQSRDTIWIGTWGRGLDILNRKTNEVIHYKEEYIGKYHINDNFVQVIYRDSKGTIWLGTRKGINIYYPETQSFIDLKDLYNNQYYPNLTGNRIYSIKEDREGKYWVATSRGLFRFDLRNLDVENFYSDVNDKNSLSVNVVNSLLIDEDGIVWIGTYTGGLNKYDPRTKKMKLFENDEKNENSLSQNTIFSMTEDKDGFIWIATETGLNKFDKRKETFKRYLTEDGLPDECIYQVQKDFQENIWVSTRRGLAVLNKTTGKINAFDPDDGLQGYEYNNGASHLGYDGELFFGGTNGLDAFYPNTLNNNPFKPKMVFTLFKKAATENDEPLDISDGDHIVLSYKENVFTIEFAALEFTKPRINKYKYKMEGLEDEWREIGNQHYVTFNNIPPGEYKFLLMGANNDGVWCDEPISITIEIKPPFWQTNVAYLIYVLLVALAIYLFLEIRTKSLKKANQILREKQLAALEIAKQKEELTVKNKNITDSINYARRIQQAMMPSQFLFRKLFPDFFILYKPKDIVSGDFYWITERNNKIFLAAVDCTGHGVPGAFMSIIGFDLLRNITGEQKVEEPAEILNLLNKGVSETFSKNVQDGTVKDGMDLSLIVIDKNEGTIEFSGAFNPMYMVRDNDIIEIKGNRFSVGMVGDTDEEKIFESHIFPYKKDDVFYIFSDGYPDQFGGPLGKKFKYRRFRHLLLTIHGMPMKKQQEFLEENIENWRGEMEQVDDILVIGFKITDLF
ncbi:MAG: hypothetical protein A2W91_17125 [Bacteroidetes bacterium GWF2_38_335]|nr:MAG: hypothetical protein A2W91_17125 [Bacteroidetes bacterium GWF2_38_335]OFY81407.1 MAG: hypothetical protein A2281_08100 [Bacteroidetes bacterium RIFOXYA12_FULL_38_20]HBS85532.1 hypothetical protein [Bacteroidales bacterium]